MTYTIYDCHTHIYPGKIARKAVRSIARFYGIERDGDSTVEALMASSRAAGVSRCLALAVSVDGEHVRHINDFLIASVGAHPDFLWGFATLHPDMEDPGREVERVLKAGMRGIKLHPDMQGFSLSEKRADRLFAACEGVCPMMLHTGDRRYHNSNPSLVPPILKRHPRLRLICAHFGGYSEWDEAAQYLKDTNVLVDTSSSFFLLSRERARRLIDLFGEDRVLFGTDFPMWNPQPEIDVLTSLGLSDRALRKIFSENLISLIG